MFDDFAFVVEAEDVDACVVLVTWPVLETVEYDQVVFGDRPLELDPFAGELFGHSLEVLDEGLLAVPDLGILLDVLVAQVEFSRLDRDDDGLIDDPGAASMDGSWTNIANAFMKPQLGSQLNELNSLFSRFDKPPGGQYSGWYQYFERDIKKLLGEDQPKPFKMNYCGDGDLQACQSAIWDAIAASGDELEIKYGDPDPSQWHSSATAEEIQFGPVKLIPMAYTNRPSGIQQIIAFNGHR